MQDPMQDPMQNPMPQDPMQGPPAAEGQDPMGAPNQERDLAEAMEKAVNMGREIIYEPEVFEGLIASVGSDPVDSLAQAVVMVMDKIMEYSGLMPPPHALGVGMALIADVADALMQTGHHEYSPPEINAAVSAAVSMFLANHEGHYAPEELNQYAQEMAQMAGMSPPGAAPQPAGPAGPPADQGYLGGM